MNQQKIICGQHPSQNTIPGWTKSKDKEFKDEGRTHTNKKTNLWSQTHLTITLKQNNNNNKNNWRKTANIVLLCTDWNIMH